VSIIRGDDGAVIRYDFSSPKWYGSQRRRLRNTGKYTFCTICVVKQTDYSCSPLYNLHNELRHIKSFQIKSVEFSHLMYINVRKQFGFCITWWKGCVKRPWDNCILYILCLLSSGNGSTATGGILQGKYSPSHYIFSINTTRQLNNTHYRQICKLKGTVSQEKFTRFRPKLRTPNSFKIRAIACLKTVMPQFCASIK
jgi:hypothetical protein